MKSRAATKGRRLFLLAAVCLLSALLLTPAAEASRSLPAALAPALSSPAMSDLVLEESDAQPQPRHRLFGNLSLLERPLDVVPIQKTASGVFALGIQSNIWQTGGLGQNRSGPTFQGLWTDPVTGIAYARNRWYDARTASWLSEDPMGDVDSPNLYAFVGWGPQSGRDPMGLRDDWNYTPEAKEFREREAAANQYRQAVEWMSENNEAYAYAKSRLPDKDISDLEFRELLYEYFKTVQKDCDPSPFFMSNQGDFSTCWDRVDFGFPQTPEAILKARETNPWYGDQQLMMLGAWGEFFENVGMMEAWWAFGGTFEEFLALGRVANVNKIVDDVPAPSVWELGPGPRGLTIEDAAAGLRPGRLPPGFRTIDFHDGIVTSTKSIDLTTKTYRDANKLLSTIKGYVNKVRDFQGGARGGVRIRPSDITGRRLDLAIPEGSLSPSQRWALEAAEQYAQGQGVSLEIFTVY